MRISDWSSDVCSSDLEHSAAIRYLPAESAAAGAKSDTVSVPATVVTAPLTAPADIKIVTPAPDAASVMPPPPGTPVRSEERRVGKERVGKCRSRWSPIH